MKCWLNLDKEHHNGYINMKMLNHDKQSFNKDTNINTIVDQLCFKLQGIKDQGSSRVGMKRHCREQSDAVRKYYAAFPALKKGEQSPIQYLLPPPSWCHKSVHNINKPNMQCEFLSKEWDTKKKYSNGKERRNSYHGHRKHNKKCHNSFSQSFESKEILPEWVTHEGVWDMESQDPVREFIKAIALDEGYGTCENTVTDEIKEIAQINLRMQETMVPDWDDIDLESKWVIKEDLNPRPRSPTEQELYAKFEAKFDRSIEALWYKDQANTPDDEYQDLPIDFQDLLSSPSDHQFYDPVTEKSSLLSLTESIWSNDAFDNYVGAGNNRFESPSRSIDILHDQFKPLNLKDDVQVSIATTPTYQEPFSLYSYEGIYESIPSIAEVMQSLSILNHSKNHSSFTEVLPRKIFDRKIGNNFNLVSNINTQPVFNQPESEQEDLLTSSKTHFCPIRKEAETAHSSTATVQYADGATFDINGELDPVKFRRSKSGFIYIETESESPKPYLQYRCNKSINYGRLNLTDAQREANKDLDDRDEFQLKFPLRQIEVGVQTEDENTGNASSAWSSCDECSRLSGAKKMKQSAIESIWSEEGGAGGRCAACLARREVEALVPPTTAPDELSDEWEELLSDITQYAAVDIGEDRWWRVDRKRRHSAALRCSRPNGQCSHPHAPFLHCCALDRPLTR